MNIVINIYNEWANMILNGKKPFEFRTNLGKHVNIGDTVYIYEAKAYQGKGAVVGEFKIKDIIKFNGRGFFERYFFEYYVRNILKDIEAAEKIKNNMKYSLSNYKEGTACMFMLSDACMEFVKKDQYPDIEVIVNDEDAQRGNKMLSDTSKWMSKIGCYNDWGETNYRYAFEIENPIRYPLPISICELKDINGDFLTKAPRSWQYIK